ncbi:cytochrome c3 family protein [Flavobacterium sp. 3HN19-14]|uniref:cytochrome c3 family protein n=1 Tax=Flavobacterium sp. 3HN19-14 TaxID=3448133 RepID=UPI003EE04353
MTGYKSLNNKQLLDACAICHSGSLGVKSKSRFLFQPGDRLEDYYYVPHANEYDVHGNQAGALSQSECFLKSGKMNCLTCHNPHENTNGNLAQYSQICISCHKSPEHSNIGITTESLKSDCITCHMPKQSSKAINFQTSHDSKISGYYLRTHRIAVYPAEKEKS